MDIEGMEYDLLYTLPAKLYSKIDKISMEFHNSLYTNEWFGKKDPELMRRTLEEGQNLVNFLQSLGYTTYLDYAHGAQGRIQATR